MKRRRLLFGGKTKGTLTVTLRQDGVLSTYNEFPVYLIKDGSTIQTNTDSGYSRVFRDVPNGTYMLRTSNNKENITKSVTVKGDTSIEWDIQPYYTVIGYVYLDGSAWSNCEVTINGNESLVTNSSGMWTTNNKYRAGASLTIITPEITTSSYLVNATSTDVVTSSSNLFTVETRRINVSKIYLRTVTITITKNGSTYSSSATKPSITFNNETQTVNPSGNTFSGVRDGTHEIKVSATTYNDSYSIYMDVSSSNTSQTIDVVGYYDLKATYNWYINDNSNNGTYYCYGATVYLRNSSGSNLTNVTTNSSGLATISASNYKVGNNTYTLYTPAVKLTNGPYVYSSSNTVHPSGGGDSYSVTNQLYCYQYDITFNLYRSGDDSNWTGTPSCTLYVNNATGNNITFSSSSFSGGSVRFTGVWWQPSYYLYVSSDTYNSSLTTSNYTFGSSTTISNDVTVTGKYYVRFQLYNSVTGTNFSNCQVQAYLHDSSGNNICVGYTDNSGIITFNGSTSYLLTYGSSFKVYVPEQSVTYNSTTYNISPTTFSKTLSTSYGTLSSGNNWFYFSGNTVTTSAPATSFTWSANFTSNSYDSYGRSYYDSLTTYREGLSLEFNNTFGVGYQVLASDSNYLVSNSFLQYDLGGKVCWRSYNWSLSFGFLGLFGLSKNAINTFTLTGLNNAGIRLGSKSLSSVGYGKVGYNISHTYNGEQYPTLLVDDSQTARWSLYRGSGFYYYSGTTEQQYSNVTLTYSASSRTISVICDYYVVNGDNTMTSAGRLHNSSYSVSLNDDSDNSYITLVLAGWCRIRNVSFSGYKK